MREIKFRGKRIDNGEWVYGYLVKQFGVFKIYDDSSEDFGNWIHEVDPETVGQYTGLHDKNGREIYEGDILRLWRSVGSNGELRREHYKPLPVTYCNIWCQFVANDESTKNQYCIWSDFGAFEVVGNVYQNPELMKESD
ncbi:YopX family protein [Ruminiclostridium papyrosolvens]|uniref:YopX protein domain-containing protein n=1 Tax=Ruminiclostridium papyrosolvens C7 TaxID=1330534 RepID=U4R416_9FIRM|nr:YopX family protein [Ruminiclostridium papyrosolvens]EPR12378.1 hypothetical protein L323_08785 [Ruminiclostridium papyrosolvens C7]